MDEAEKLIEEYRALKRPKKPLPPGHYEGVLQQNEAGYYIRAKAPDGTLVSIPITFRVHTLDKE